MAQIKLTANSILVYLVALGMLGWLVAMAGEYNMCTRDAVCMVMMMPGHYAAQIMSPRPMRA